MFSFRRFGHVLPEFMLFKYIPIVVIVIIIIIIIISVYSFNDKFVQLSPRYT